LSVLDADLNAAGAESCERAATIESLRTQVQDAQAQIARLEAELKDERWNGENLSELANERREQVTKLEERLEEAEERHAEAAWRLGKAQHFERLARKRRKWIGGLIKAIGAKHKSNTALKAGLDSLRTYKLAAEANQQKLLTRVDKLARQLREAEATIKQQQQAVRTEEALAAKESDVAELTARLNAQIELIQTLEDELKTVKASRRSHDEKEELIEQLQAEVAQKNDIIQKLETDADEQQRRLAKLRGSESETVRLKAVSTQHQEHIDALEREVAELKETLARHGGAAAGPDLEQTLRSKLEERDESIARLVASIKEHEATVAELKESVRTWKRKYEFLAVDEAPAYKATAEK
jgi:chromosome segregation ATPase